MALVLKIVKEILKNGIRSAQLVGPQLRLSGKPQGVAEFQSFLHRGAERLGMVVGLHQISVTPNEKDGCYMSSKIRA